MHKITYTHTATGQSWDYRLPRILRLADRDVMGITEATMAQFGITKTTVDITDAPPAETVISDALAAKERTFAGMLLHYATAFGVDLTALPDINISAMLKAAQAAGATAAEIAEASAILMALFNDVVVESGGTPGKAWEDLKERLPGYMAEITHG